MASLTIKGIPPELMEELRARAAADRRSMNKEIIHLLGVAVAGSPPDDAARRREIARAQADAWKRLAGRWRSDVSPQEEVEAIYAARSRGRPVDL